MDSTCLCFDPFRRPAESQLKRLQPPPSTKLLLSVFCGVSYLLRLCDEFSEFGRSPGIVCLKTVIGRTAWKKKERGELGRRELPSNCVEVKVVWMGVVRDDFEEFLLWGIVLGESGDWLLAMVKMEILLGVAVTQVVLFLQEVLG